MLNEYIKCVSCKGYTKDCEDYKPNNEPGEESLYCSHYIDEEKVKEMTKEDKEKLRGDLEKLFEGKIENDEEKQFRHPETSDILALVLSC